MTEKIVIVDYGMGNLHSVQKAFQSIGAEVEVTSSVQKIALADRLVLPGVGAFGDCMKNLRAYGLDEVICEFMQNGRPFLGICLGLQLLFEESEESPGCRGLGVFKGKVRLIETTQKIPHMGWNNIELRAASPLWTKETGYYYFVHSYQAEPKDKKIITAVCDYGTEVTAAIGYQNVQAVQFHPEKSGKNGLALLVAFKEWQL